MRAQAQCTIEWPRLHGFQTATRSFFVNWQHTRARVLLAQLLVVQLLQSALAVQEPEACSKPTPDDSKASTPCGTHDLSDWLNEADREIRGYHLLCITSLAPSEKVRVSAMRHGLLAGRTVFELPTSDEQSMRHELEMGLEMTAQSRDASRAPAVAIPRLAQPGGYLRQPWRVFDTGGQHMQLADLGRSLARPSQYSQSHLLLVFEGGVWRWPGVRVGFARRILVPGNEDLRLKPSTVTMLTASLSPLVFIFPRSVAPEITSHVLTSASGQMEPSKVGHGNTGESGDVVDLDVSDTDARSSTQTWLWTGRNPELQSVDSFVSTVTRQPKDHMEDTQVLRYDVGQRYNEHHDYWDPVYFADPKMWRQDDMGYFVSRLCTVFMYGRQPERGGATHFPHVDSRDRVAALNNSALRAAIANTNANDVNRTRVAGGDCTKSVEAGDGLAFLPRPGSALLFYSMDAAGQLDESSLHSGCAVEIGEKWTFSKFVWNWPSAWVHN